MIVQKNRTQLIKRWAIAIALILLFGWAFSGVPLTGVKDTAGEVFGAIVKGLVHPDWSYVYTGDGEDLLSALLETLAIAFLGTFISAFLAVPIAFIAAKTSKKFISVHSGLAKFFLTFIRVFPQIVLAIMFTKAVGPGAYAGVLALAVHSIGMMGKLFSEGIENVDKGANEGIKAAGGSKLAMLSVATFPEVLPEFINYTLYRFEIAVRSAAILGIVGAGGIGAPLIFALSARAWSRVGIILIGIVVMVTIIDLISGQIRKKLI
ncbi:phosphonate ABC transporter, permease protein PhnE [Fructobacillus sp. W13]|uniref:Phosphonate ABC transporter, permease protein PhnE n=1 Tax=Fructobacillus apis TaxID=2935017 RepID=A0ABT0ZNB5_9LACO|nr:phosphonate ABC transporter, permease protein PhnE [Fructobacillus apis]MCO0831491.1 phosphonate ABC transporter, permease protein PhnE [Fructobacillus apis]